VFQPIARAISKLLAAALLWPIAAAALIPADDELGNWFNDPFMQVRQGFPGCPVPLGPRLTKAEMRTQEHSRAERGTRCWLAGECKKPNSYLYDADIAQDLANRFAKSRAFAGSALWITVQRRFVFIEGCVKRANQAHALEVMAKRVPDVELVIVNVTADPGSKPPYPALEASRPR
jgi:BON domain-containing protein